jgi:hypothetical protein
MRGRLAVRASSNLMKIFKTLEIEDLIRKLANHPHVVWIKAGFNWQKK